jgi:hypothetical protein
MGGYTQALAMHAKPGDWQVSVKMDIAGMPQMPPAQMAKLHSMGGHLPMSVNSITMTHCMTAAEAAMDRIPAMPQVHQKYCSMQNIQTSSDGMSADMVCTGKVQGGGHMQVHFDSPEHYAGKVSMHFNANGHPVSTSSTFEAKWISAACKTGQ